MVRQGKMRFESDTYTYMHACMQTDKGTEVKDSQSRSMADFKTNNTC